MSDHPSIIFLKASRLRLASRERSCERRRTMCACSSRASLCAGRSWSGLGLGLGFGFGFGLGLG